MQFGNPISGQGSGIADTLFNGVLAVGTGTATTTVTAIDNYECFVVFSSQGNSGTQGSLSVQITNLSKNSVLNNEFEWATVGGSVSPFIIPIPASIGDSVQFQITAAGGANFGTGTWIIIGVGALLVTPPTVNGQFLGTVPIGGTRQVSVAGAGLATATNSVALPAAPSGLGYRLQSLCVSGATSGNVILGSTATGAQPQWGNLAITSGLMLPMAGQFVPAGFSVNVFNNTPGAIGYTLNYDLVAAPNAPTLI